VWNLVFILNLIGVVCYPFATDVKTRPPVFSLEWPQEGMILCSTDFDVRCHCVNPKAVVTALLCDDQGTAAVQDAGAHSETLQPSARFCIGEIDNPHDGPAPGAEELAKATFTCCSGVIRASSGLAIK
jgi:hypothetical protein